MYFPPLSDFIPVRSRERKADCYAHSSMTAAMKLLFDCGYEAPAMKNEL
jgi:hypothetical protein